MLPERKSASSLSIIMPAYNETENLNDAYESVLRALEASGITDYEILLMTVVGPDGKHDGTPDLAARIAGKNPKVKHIHTPFFAGLGFKYREGAHMATKDFVMLIPAHNLTEESSLVNIMLAVGNAEAIFTYTSNPESRPQEVRFVSQGYVTLCNILFGLNMRYYNGISAVRRDLLLQIPISSDDHSCMAEILVYIVKSGIKYIELPQVLKKNTRTGRAWNVENTFKVMGTIGSLFWKISIKEEKLSIAALNSASPPQSTLPNPDGPPDVRAVAQFIGNNAVQTAHKTLVYMVKSVVRSLEPHFASSSISIKSFKDVFKILGVLGSLISKIGAKMATVESAASLPKIKKESSQKVNEKANSFSLTIIMPAYNEAKRLNRAYESAIRCIRRAGISNFEILLATITRPDGSHDGTPEIARKIAENDHLVRLLHSGYQGLGCKYRQAIKEAQKDYVMVIPGDGEFDEDSTVELIAHIGKADIIVPYIANPEIRSFERQTVSQTFTGACNTAFGLNIKYYNGPCIIRTQYVRAVPMKCDNYAYMAEVLAYLIKSGAGYIEVPWKIKASENSKAFNAESVSEALETLMSVAWKIRVEGTRIQLSPSNK
jgi:glycosyltransferase involved in cell wall biosynthesis